MTWTLTIQAVPPSGNIIKRMAWQAYSKLMREWFWLVRAAPGFNSIPKSTVKRRLTITLRGRNQRDRDNLYASMKPVIDVLRPSLHQEGHYKTGPKAGEIWSRHRIGHGLIMEDDSEHLDLVVRQVPLRKGEVPNLVLELEDIDMSHKQH